MPETNQEAQGYHCLNTALKADYEALKKLWEEYQSWDKAWKKKASNYPNLNPGLNTRLVLREEKDYPKLLKEISWPAFGLYVKGHFSEQPTIAIVGTRKATLNGKTLAKNLARDLSNQGITIVSGLAMGIDTAAHQGAVEAKGQTLAVLANGLNTIYPSQNTNLAKEILDLNGALISEYPPDLPSYPVNFIRRNRIISGLSLGTVVIEAPEKSGALSTARFAIEQNREVMVIPGPANHSNYVGSHNLIREGAKLVTSAKEIMEELNLEFKPCAKAVALARGEGVAKEEQAILDAIKELGWPTSIDKISQVTKIEVPQVNKIITFLILRGILKE